MARCLVPLALILLATTWPISDYQDHAHWTAVEWIPFTHYQRAFDVVANVVLFVPFGWALAWRGERRGVGLAALVGLSLSLLVELSQVYTHNRIATVTDLLTNTTGAWLGAWLATRGESARGSALATQDRDQLRAS